jgi:hypothetical protein
MLKASCDLVDEFFFGSLSIKQNQRFIIKDIMTKTRGIQQEHTVGSRKNSSGVCNMKRSKRLSCKRLRDSPI